MSDVGRRLGRDPLALIADAVGEALGDAGVSLADIDGIASTPGAWVPGYSGSGTFDVIDMLGLRPVWLSGGPENSGHTGPVANAMLAIASGLCHHVLCFVSTWESTYDHLVRSGEVARRAEPRVAGEMMWRAAFGAPTVAPMIAMAATGHMHAFGTHPRATRRAWR